MSGVAAKFEGRGACRARVGTEELGPELAGSGSEEGNGMAKNGDGIGHCRWGCRRCKFPGYRTELLEGDFVADGCVHAYNCENNRYDKEWCDGE